MSNTLHTSHSGTFARIAKRLRQAGAEMDYAQRRVTEIRTGLPLVDPAKRRFSPR